VTYIREFDGATMIEIAPHCYLNETAARAFRLHHTSVTGLKHHEDTRDGDPERGEIAPELTGHGLPLSECEAYNRVYDQFYRSR
jgi:hypothetical protein